MEQVTPERAAGPAGRCRPPPPGAGGGQAGLLGVPQGLSVLKAPSFSSMVVLSRETKLLTPIDQ